MITVREFPGKSFTTQKDLFRCLKDNKGILMAAKKMDTKFADSVNHSPLFDSGSKEGTEKATSIANWKDINAMTAELVINTTKLFDSHHDVHLDGIWNKSVKEVKNPYLLEEHMMKFKGIISDEMVPSVKTFSWKELGYKFDGDTQALVFTGKIPKDRNEYMFEQYAKGNVRNHSVGMRYVRLELAVNDDDRYWIEEKEVWEKYFDVIANKEEAEEAGYFWAVHEAKIIEGSAVPVGSNWATPVRNMEAVTDTSDKSEPSPDTRKGKLLESILTNLKND